MTEQPQPEPYYYEDIIDLRELIRTLWNYKWTIIAATLLAAVAAFLTDNFILPPQYEASAHVGIRRPTFQADLEPSIENPSSIENYQQLRNLTDSLPELAESDDVWQSVCQEMGLKCVGEDDEKPDLKATLVGTNQLKLTVTCEDPQQSAEFANVWAGEVIRRWNMLYGSESINLSKIEEEVAEARQRWEQTQNNLEAYLPQSKVNVVQVQLEQAEQNLNRYMDEMEGNERLIRDARSLDNRLQGLAPSAQLPVGEALSLIALQQRTTGGISGTQFQLPGAEILGQDFTVADGRKGIAGLITALEDQNASLADALPTLEEEIASLAVELESEQHKISQLEQERDRARQEYSSMAGYFDEARINKENQGPASYSIAPARVPQRESGQSTIMIVALAGIVGVMIALGSVLIYSWWTTGEETE